MNLFSDLIAEDDPMAGGTQFVRLATVKKMLAVSRPTIYRLVERGDLPKPIKIGSGSFWVKSELLAWQAEKLANR